MDGTGSRAHLSGSNERWGAMSRVPIEELLKLPVAERIQLVEDLWDSIAADPEGLPLTEVQREELSRRVAEHQADPASAVSWQEVRERLYKKYG
jgi:putative addiction module component (TIGR02574 family)